MNIVFVFFLLKKERKSLQGRFKFFLVNFRKEFTIFRRNLLFILRKEKFAKFFGF